MWMKENFYWYIWVISSNSNTPLHQKKVYLWSRVEPMTLGSVDRHSKLLTLSLTGRAMEPARLELCDSGCSKPVYVACAFYLHFNTTVQTQNFPASFQGVSTPYRYDFRPAFWAVFAKTYEQFSSGKNRVYPSSSGDSIIKCGSCTYSSGKLENKSKKAFIYLKKEKEKKHSRQCTRGPAMRVLQSGRCPDQAWDRPNIRHAVV